MIDGVAYATPNDVPHVRFVSVSPGYFETFRDPRDARPAARRDATAPAGTRCSS